MIRLNQSTILVWLCACIYLYNGVNCDNVEKKFVNKVIQADGEIN